MRAWPSIALVSLLVACSHDAPPIVSTAPSSTSSSASSAPPVESAPPVVSATAVASSAPVSVAPHDERLAAIDDVVAAALARGDVKGAVVLVTTRDRVAYKRAFGEREANVAMTDDTLFDLASLTKPLATALAIWSLVDDRALNVTDRARKWLPELDHEEHAQLTIEQLLLHTGGLVADDPLGDYDHGLDAAVKKIAALGLTTTPGEVFEYSDVGYVLLGAIVQRAAKMPLEKYVRERVYSRLGLTTTGFSPTGDLAARAAPTEQRDGALLRGVVHDPRAARLGGVAGHAGLFATAEDIGAIARMLLNSGGDVLSPAVVRAMTTPVEVHVNEGTGTVKRARGWDVDTHFSGPRGALNAGFGHTGFTGTSIWIEPKRGVGIVVLTSRLYPDGKGNPSRMRREVADVVARALAKGSLDVKGPVSLGIDELEREGCARLRGKRVGLVINAASRDASGKSTARALKDAGVSIATLFTPEHGLGADREGANAIARDPETGLDVRSLYGEKTRPSDDDLRGLDALVIDLQDAGARFYTYETTLFYALEAAAKNHVEVVVLDRPNPLGGAVIDGPMLDRDRLSFVGYHPLPVRHGLTMGELARLFVAEKKLEVKLDVVLAKGLDRKATWSDTGLAWRAPSPNLRSADEALLYPGVALLETTDVSVGRGTDTPFEVVGAPWIDGQALAAELAKTTFEGLSFAPVTFAPTTATHGHPLYSGVRIILKSSPKGRGRDAVRAGLALALALHKLYPKDFEPRRMMTIVGNEAVVSAIARGASLAEVEALYAADLKAFAERRKPFLLY
jgi:uncharacterized protein YbbC (DUF1343 family)/CubicO group peptidase (beta-lactamase class C family)